MASITGGVFSKPKGKTGGVVFGSARSRQGKITTVRQLVPPSNPNTAGQQTQRNKFSECQTIVRTLSPTVYQTDFNRAVGQLPGFQSLNSIFLSQIQGDLDLEFTIPVNLGTLHNPATCAAAAGAGTREIAVTWSTENGDNGTANDIAVIIWVKFLSEDRTLPLAVGSSQTVLRSAGTATITTASGSDIYSLYVYFRGAGTALGNLSVANPYSATSHA